MTDDVRRLRDLLKEGRCCAVALVQLGLEMLGEQNERLLQAVSGLCGGVRAGLLCGALTGAACLMGILDPANAETHAVPELAEWFVDMSRAKYGGAECRAILGGDPVGGFGRCADLVEATYLRAKEIMAAYGFETPVDRLHRDSDR